MIVVDWCRSLERINHDQETRSHSPKRTGQNGRRRLTATPHDGEVAQILDSTQESVTSALKRARATLQRPRERGHGVRAHRKPGLRDDPVRHQRAAVVRASPGPARAGVTTWDPG